MSLKDVNSKSEGTSTSKGVAIIGMACLYPKAHDLQTFWQNIVSKVDAITEVDPEIWSPEIYYNPDPNVDDKIYCKRGGYLGHKTHFNPLKYGIMPIALVGGEPDQFVSVRLAFEALDNAGYLDKPFNKKQAKIIIGKGNYPGPGSFNLFQHISSVDPVMRIIRLLNPDFSEEELKDIRKTIKSSLIRIGYENAASVIPNMLPGRIANRFDFMGSNFTVDAACASSLIATEIGFNELVSGRADFLIAGGSHMFMAVPFLSIFCRLRAMSLTSQIRPFDKKADGLLHGEGIGFMILKRLEDAERDGDRIYAVIKGVGSSSDGKAMSVVAPRVEGEELALKRAYESSGIDPSTIGLIEGHGTATTVGDIAELECLDNVFGERDEEDKPPRTALGSVKSMIGHTMPAAGAASMIKVALALYHKILPPTINCDEPNPKIDWNKSNLYINTETRPWIHGYDTPRRAAVNAFGFGGVNAHVIMEEYIPSDETKDLEEGESLWHEWDSEVLILQGESRQALIQEATKLQKYLKDMAKEEITILLKDLAYTLNSKLKDNSVRLSIIASSLDDLQEKLEYSIKRLSDPANIRIKYIKGVFYFDKPLREKGKIAFMFPGEGSQYLNMLSDLCMHFPDVRKVFDMFDEFAIKNGDPYTTSQIIFPPPAFSESERKKYEERIWAIEGALQSVVASGKAIDQILSNIGIRPDMIVGHSSGELVAMVPAGISIIDNELFQAITAINKIHKKGDDKIPKAVMVAVGAGRDTISSIVDEIGDKLYVAMDNCPHQVVVVGEELQSEKFIDILRKKNILYEKLNFDRGYHTPMFEEACNLVLEQFKNCNVKKAEIPLYSCTRIAHYPDEPQDIIDLTAEHWKRPVEFQKTIEAMYDDGARIFVEVGPNGNLTAFVDDILKGREYIAFPSNIQRRSGISQLNNLVGILAAHGVSMDLGYFYKRRSPKVLSLDVEKDKKLLKEDLTDNIEISLKFPELRVDEYLKSHKKSRILEEPSKKQTAINDQPEVSDKQTQVKTQEPVKKPEAIKDEQPMSNIGSWALNAEHSDLDSNMTEYMKIMNHFLDVQNEVMSAYLSSNVDISDSGQTATLPFIGEIVSYVPEQEVTVIKHLNLDEEIFLLDHTFGGKISVDESLFPMPIIPMTVSAEIMAEVASLLQQGKVLVEMKQFQAIQWIKVVADAPATIHISAKIKDITKGEVSVEIRNLSDNSDKDPAEISPIVKGVMVFGDSYPAPPEIKYPPLDNAVPCKKTAKEMYKEYLMFHGPKFQGIFSLDGISDKGLDASLIVLSKEKFVKSDRNPLLLTDPILIDSAGQVMGYWPLEQLKTGYVMFPIGFDSLKLYAPNHSAGEQVECRVRLRNLNSSFVNMDADIIDENGNLWIHILGWRDWRFYFSEKAVISGRFPNREFFCTPFNEMLIALEAFCGVKKDLLEACVYDSDFMDKVDSFWMDILIQRVLGHYERAYYKSLNWSLDRKYEWLYARIAAKDNIRAYVLRRYGLELYPADVAIRNDDHGRPFVDGYWLDDIKDNVSISLSHSNGIAVAITGELKHLGIDVEKISRREPNFVRLAFTDREKAILGNYGNQDKVDEIQTRFWCAKEAVAKALGCGLDNPLDLSVLDYQEKILNGNIETGVAKVILGDKLAAQFPTIASRETNVCSFRYKDFIIAATAWD